ncbi:MAG: glycosyltransferase [Marinomonas colpomeniae]
MTLAPIVLFVYNRPWHTQKTVEALQKNELAEDSHLIIYSDSSKNDNDLPQVKNVRDYLRTIIGFKTVTIIEREENWGLANSITDGVTKVVNDYGTVIVLEDDIVTSPDFLSFMNQALTYYRDEKKVWHISGWNYPILKTGLGDAFFVRVMNCWGWATWSDRWEMFEKNPGKLIDKWSTDKINHFDLEGSGVFWNQVIANAESKINTWAIFWYATIYENEGLCLNPSQTYVDNIGHDGSGVHCKEGKNYIDFLSTSTLLNFPNNIEENELAVSRIIKKLEGKILSKIKYFLKGLI